LGDANDHRDTLSRWRAGTSGIASEPSYGLGSAMSPETASDAHDGRPGELYERLGRSIASTSIGPSIISVIARQPDPSFGG